MTDLWLLSALVSQPGTPGLIGHRAAVKRSDSREEAMGKFLADITEKGYSVDDMDCVKLRLEFIRD